MCFSQHCLYFSQHYIVNFSHHCVYFSTMCSLALCVFYSVCFSPRVTRWLETVRWGGVLTQGGAEPTLPWSIVKECRTSYTVSLYSIWDLWGPLRRAYKGTTKAIIYSHSSRLPLMGDSFWLWNDRLYIKMNAQIASGFDYYKEQCMALEQLQLQLFRRYSYISFTFY